MMKITFLTALSFSKGVFQIFLVFYFSFTQKSLFFVKFILDNLTDFIKVTLTDAKTALR